MNLEVDTHSPVPHYEQIRSQVAAAVLTGVLEPGTRLPTIRQLARDLRLAVNTVARAYHELENQGLVHTRGKKGTFIAEPSHNEHDGHAEHGRDERRQLLRQAAVTYASTAHALGLSPDHAASTLHDVTATAATPNTPGKTAQ